MFITFQYNLQYKSHKPYGPPTAVTWQQLLRKQSNSGTSTDLRAQNFVPSHEWSHDLGSLSFEAGDFVELLLLHQTAAIRQTYHLSSIQHTAAALKAAMCDWLRHLFWNFDGHALLVNLHFAPVFAKEWFCSLHGHIVCVCVTQCTCLCVGNRT